MSILEPHAILAGLPVIKPVRTRRESSWDRTGGNRDAVTVEPDSACDHVTVELDFACTDFLVFVAICHTPTLCRSTRACGTYVYHALAATAPTFRAARL